MVTVTCVVLGGAETDATVPNDDENDFYTGTVDGRLGALLLRLFRASFTIFAMRPPTQL